jgi:alkyl hydroperoxide reductase subunit F
MYDLVIIGGGPAGAAATVYAARKKLKTLLITKEFGGQSSVSDTIYNWIGTPEISGADLAKSFQEHVEYYNDGEILTVKRGYNAETVLKNDDGTFTVKDEEGVEHITRTVLVASGSSRRKLPAEGANRLEHKGLTYCATCDGPLFADMDVAVIGGGNAGFESAAQLLAYCKSVTLLHRSDTFKADPITVEKVLANPHMTAIKNANTTKVTGENFVDGLVYDDKDGNQQRLEVKGIFVEIGQIPNSHIVSDIVELNEYNQIVADPYTQKTSQKGIWAAGDVTDVRYHQNNISAGDAVKALEDIYKYLKA